MQNQLNEKCFVALGTFDGLHKGHKSVITAGEYENRKVLLFKEHPQKVLTGEAPTELTTKRIQQKILSAWGAKAIWIDFNEVCTLSPEDFFTRILVGKIGAEALSVGFNYRFGKNAAGDVNCLRKLCEKAGIELFVSPEVTVNGETVSATKIREALKNGEIAKANEMLGRDFSYDFTVVHGDERGRTIGAPTINQFFDESFTVPQYGVYAGITFVEGKAYPSVTNIGIRPTIGNSRERSETHILGFDGNLYDKNIEVSIHSKMRDEMKFSSLSQLEEQIRSDKERANLLAEGKI